MIRCVLLFSGSSAGQKKSLLRLKVSVVSISQTVLMFYVPCLIALSLDIFE